MTYDLSDLIMTYDLSDLIMTYDLIDLIMTWCSVLSRPLLILVL